ncbi:MAG: hypothetical protein JKY27_02455 [Magnetovibrio sp.]|nr:hypothetical protein [Magnetovibrio sp.]
MTSLEIFLSIVATGIGLVSLWVIADVTKKLTRQTHQMIAETQQDVVRMLDQSNQAGHALDEKYANIKHTMLGMKQAHKKEIARLKAAIAEKQDKPNRRHRGVAA